MPKAKRAKDVNQLAKQVADLATGLAREELIGDSTKNQAAQALGRQGGAKGGAARAKALSAKRRKEIAQTAARKRWKKTTQT